MPHAEAAKTAALMPTEAKPNHFGQIVLDLVVLGDPQSSVSFNTIHQFFEIDVQLVKILQHISVVKPSDVDFWPVNLWQGFVGHILLFLELFIQNMPCLSGCLIDVVLQLNFLHLVWACINFYNHSV